MNKTILGILVFFALLFAIIYFSPVETGGDWNMLSIAIREWVYEGKELYRVHPVANGATTAPYVYTPFATVLMLPFALLPQRFVWTIMVISNQVIILGLCRRFGIGLPKAILLMLCPASFYNVMFGQVDIVFLGLVALPEDAWGFVALVKPQLLMGLLVESLRSKERFFNTFKLVGVLGLVSLLFWDWPIKVIQLSQRLAHVPHNAMQLVWPYGIPLGIGLLALGFWKKDRLLYVAGSPFLSFYASTGSLIGIALALAKYLRTWLFFIVWLAWWSFIFWSA